ncbi:MAG: hypothetical protein FJ130_01905 [Deltaproteobacteria bacterium]|nr:hypothetical protein [Deltaproteobacteria bacterium]
MSNKADSSNPSNCGWDARFLLAIVILVCSIGGACVMAVYVLTMNKNLDTAQYVFGAMLPLLGTWVGTVLAYYFARENFESASRSVREMAKQLTPMEKLKSITIKDVMIIIGKAVTLELQKPEKDIKLKADIIDAILGKENKERLPILDTEGRIKYMAHRSLIDKFIVQEVGKGKKAEDLTLQDMLDDAKFKDVLTGSFKTLLETSNLAEAKTLMDKIKICSDVFATEDGTPNSKVLGWVTNIIVGEQARV